MVFSVHELAAAVRWVKDAEAVDEVPAVMQGYAGYYGLAFAGARHRMGCFMCDGFRIVTQCWQPQGIVRGTVFVMHGYYDHLGLYGSLIEFLLEKQLAVVGCDLPGHGLSSGARASIEGFSQYQRVLQGVLLHYETLPQPWYFLGQSTGAAIGLDYVLHEPAQVFRQVFLLSPLIRPKGWWWIKRTYGGLRLFTSRIRRYFSVNSHDQAFVHFVREQDPLQPQSTALAWVGALIDWVVMIDETAVCEHSVVIVQGTEDATVDWKRNIVQLHRLFRQPRVIYVPSARHHLVNESLVLRQQCFAAIASFLP